MRLFISCCLLIVGVFGPTGASAQWSLVQGAVEEPGGCIRLTNTSQNQRGGAWHDCQLSLDADFDLEFTVSFGTTDADGADGIVFVLQPFGVGNNVIGSTGGSIGYENGPFNPSLAVEMDTWQNADVGDPWFDHIALTSDGSIFHNVEGPVQAHSVLSNIENGQDFPFRVVWDAGTQTLEVYFDGDLRLTYTGDIATPFFGGNPLVHWGFVASTGGAVGNQQRFCLVEADFTTHPESVTAGPEGPWEVCLGDELVLTAEPVLPATSAVWADNGEAQLAITQAGTYDLLGTDDQGCPASGAIEVTEAPGPELELLVDPNLVVCGGTEAELIASASPDATVTWDGVEGLTAVTTEPGVHEVVASVEGCQTALQVDVLFQAIPEVSFALQGEAVVGPLEVCAGEPLTLQALATEGGSPAWEVGNSPFLSVTSSGDYMASASINGCVSEPQSIAVDVLPLPQGLLEATPPSLCWEGVGSVALSLEENASLNNWELPDGTFNLDQAGAGTYTANLVGENGCENALSLNYPMLPPIATGLLNPEPLCENSATVLSITHPMDHISWNVGGTDDELYVVSSMGGGPFVATVTLGACTETDTAHVTWWPTPFVGSHPDSVVRCELDGPHEFIWPTQTSPAIGSWVWSVNGEPATAGYDAFAEGDYDVEVRDNATGCNATHSMNLEVWPSLTAAATPDDNLICMGDSTLARVEVFSIGGSDVNEIPFSVVWDSEELTGMTTPVAGGDHFVTVTNACGSHVALAEVEEEYCGCHIWVPTAFTPDRDGVNEGFRVVSTCDWAEFSFKIFNRWGQQVWSTKDPDAPWDGGAYDLGGGDHFLPDGWYTYVLEWGAIQNGIWSREVKHGRVLLAR